MRGELQLSSEPNASRLRTVAAFISPGKDQVPFKAAVKANTDAFAIPVAPPMVSVRMTGSGETTSLGKFTFVGHDLAHLSVRQRHHLDDTPLHADDWRRRDDGRRGWFLSRRGWWRYGGSLLSEEGGDVREGVQAAEAVRRQ